MSRNKVNRMGPESDEYNRLKGKMVRIWPQNGQIWVGRLIWVDFYTLGVAMDPEDPTNVSIIYKAGIRIERYEKSAPAITGERDNNGAATP